jgi:hypothetical protein
VKIEIKHRWTGAVLYSTEVDDSDPLPLKTALVGANLDGANLDGANLDGANLDGANLVGANLDGANLVRANLDGANLVGANLVGANLDGIREDFRAVLDLAPLEVPGLLLALREGRVDGSQYQGECACLVGTIANIRGCNYQSLARITPNSDRPAERWFLAIRRGCTPDTHPVAAITEDWILEWLAERGEGELVSETTESNPSATAGV